MIGGWLARLVLAFVIVGVAIFDGGSILVNFFTLDSRAEEIAIELTTGTHGSRLNMRTLEPQAEELAKESGARLLEVRLEDDVLYVTLRRRADTLVVGRIGPIRDWARATAEGQAGTG